MGQKFSDLITGGIEINRVAMFRSGDYGSKGKYDESDLDKMAASYDPNYLEAPVTKDHLQWGPSDGWIKRIYREGDMLYGDWVVHPDTYNELKEGRYKRRSIEFYPAHKMPNGEKVMYVSACSILGAATPHAKGLPNIQFSDTEADDSVVSFAFEAKGENEVIYFTEGSSEMDELKQAMSEIEKLKADNEAKSKQLSDTLQRVDEQSKLIEQANEQFSKLTAQVQRVHNTETFNKIISENRGKVTPAQEPILSALFMYLAELPAENVIQYGEGEAASNVSPANLLAQFIQAGVDVVPVNDTHTVHNIGQFNSVSKAKVNPNDPKSVMQFNMLLVQKTEELMNADKNLSYADAQVKAATLLNG